MHQLKFVNSVDYVVIIGYMILVVSTSIYLSRYVKKTDDYFKAGGRMPWFLAGISNFMSGFSAFMFVAAAGFTYKYGLPAIVIFTSAFWAYWLGYFVYGKLWRRARLSSPMEFLTRRFSPSTTYYYTIVSVIPQILGLGVAIYILCIFVSTALGLNTVKFGFVGVEIEGFQVAIVIIGLVIILDTIFGGLWAAVVSDMIKFLIVFLMALIVFVVAFIYLGGEGGFVAGVQKLLWNSPEGYFKFHTEFQTPFFFAAYIIQVFMGYNIAWQLGQRYYSVPDERDTKKMALISAGLSIIGPLLWIVPVMISRQIFPNINELWPQIADPSEASFVSLAMLVLPHGMIGVVVAAILAATIGASNDTFGWLAAVFTKGDLRVGPLVTIHN
jgi:Na+/proline symporter